MKVAIYSRKSLFTGKGESVENQIEMCRQYIKFSMVDVEVVDEDIFVYEDEGYSAKNLKRPQFQQMMKDLDTYKFAYIVCYRLDRLSRNVSDFSGLIELLNNKGVNLICIKEHFDTSSPMGKAMMYITSVFAQLERETIAERVRDNMHLLARTGRWLGGTPPTGYQGAEESEIIVDGKVKISHKLVFSDEIETVKLMYNHFLETHSVSAVSKHLIAKKIKSKTTGKYFSVLGIRDILQNPVYCIADENAYNYFAENGSDICQNQESWNGEHGVSTYNKRDYSRSGAPRNSLNEWIVAIGRHEGIISGKDWVSIQKYFHSNHKEKVVNHSEVGLLSGLIYCTKCGEKMFSKKHKATSDNFSYICSSKLKGNNALCDCPNLTGQQTDDLVVDYIKGELDNFDTFTSALENLKVEYEKEQGDDKADKIKKDIEITQNEINTLVNRLTDTTLSQVAVNAIDKKIVEQTEYLHSLENELAQLNQTDSSIDFDADALIESVKSFKNLFDDLSIYDKRQIIRLLIQKIEWDGADLHIFMYGE